MCVQGIPTRAAPLALPLQTAKGRAFESHARSVKVYAHYDDAWWRNALNLTAGMYNNSAAWRSDAGGLFTAEDCLAAKQTPFPVQGSYHDGDVRCDASGAKCRGFLQAAYMGDPQAVRLYEEFHLSGNDSAVVLDPARRADHRFALRCEQSDSLWKATKTSAAKPLYRTA